MNLIIRPIQPKDYLQAHAFQCEYLDQESYEQFVQRAETHPELYFVAMDGTELAGVCYGGRSRRDPSCVHLQGIAVNLAEHKPYARTGIGSKLIGEFEKAAQREGYQTVGVGAADDRKVEHFYLKNKFVPIELVAKGSNYEELERISISNYESGKNMQEQLRAKHDAQEVIFIFEKKVDPAPSS